MLSTPEPLLDLATAFIVGAGVGSWFVLGIPAALRWWRR